MPEYYIGLMSGTSVDGIDAALVDFTDATRLVSFSYFAYPTDLKRTIHRISLDKNISLSDYGSLDCQLGNVFAECVNTLLSKANIPAEAIKAIGSHGHTVHHAPSSQHPFSLQIGDPNIIAEHTGITTAADFRRRDMAAGGQGAPLVPAFHEAIFKDSTENRVIVNIGGIANISILSKADNQPVTGFDTGPGNTLMDYWIQKNLNAEYDKNGDWANSGDMQADLVAHFKQDPYFSAPPPKSTGKEYFCPDWLQTKLETFERQIQPIDIQASLCQLTAETIADAIKASAPNTKRVLLCGGGTHNQCLVEKLKQQLSCSIQSTAESGIHPDHVEAMAFAWLAKQTLTGQVGSVSTVTGAKSPRVLGGIYPGAASICED